MKINRLKMDSSVEKRILAGMIVSKDFLDRVYPLLNLNYFETPYIKDLVKLASSFYETYAQPPVDHIKEMVFGNFKEQEHIDLMIRTIDDILSLYRSGNFNIEYIIDQAISFFKKKEIEIVITNAQILIDRGEIDKAESEIASYHKITKSTLEESDFIFSESAIMSVNESTEDNSLLSLPKDLGKFIGGLKRGWLVGISGPFKRGKCKSGSTKVILPTGEIITLKEVVEKRIDKVLAFDESTMKVVVGNVVEFYQNGEKPLFRLKTKSGQETLSTADHQYLTSTGWKEWKDIEIGDYVCTVKKSMFGTTSIASRFNKNLHNDLLDKLINSDIFFDEVVEKDYHGVEPTYDITVEKYHNFIGDNIVTHNSWLLNEFAVIAALSSLRVAYFSLEMSAVDVRKRIYQRLTGTSDEHGLHIFPCFDCRKNQQGECTKDIRTNHHRFPGKYMSKSKYKPCCVCKDIPEERRDFELVMWNEEIDIPQLSTAIVNEKIQALKKLGKANIWLKTKPRFSASVGDLESDLNNLEVSKGFFPDVIVVDYADILQADDDSLSGVQKEDEVWMALARMATKRNALVITATQLNKESLTAKQISTAHTARWIGKLGHVDVMLALNQTPEEKSMGILRMSILEHRHKRFVETQNCYVLQNLSVGQPVLDSYTESNFEEEK